MSEQLTELLAATPELPNHLTGHNPVAETHHVKCGAPWMPQYTVDADGDGIPDLQHVCPVCGALKRN